jgi:hypothetical protein
MTSGFGIGGSGFGIGGSGFEIGNRKQIGKHEAVPLHDLAVGHRNWRIEHRSRVGKCVEFAPFSTRIDRFRKLVEKISIELPAGHRPTHDSRVEAGDFRP